MELQLPSVAADFVCENWRLSRLQGAFAAFLPRSIQRSEARRRERFRGSDVPTSGSNVVGPPRMEEPPQLLHQVGSERHRQVLGKGLAISRDGGNQVPRDDEPHG